MLGKWRNSGVCLTSVHILTVMHPASHQPELLLHLLHCRCLATHIAKQLTLAAPIMQHMAVARMQQPALLWWQMRHLLVF